ncbi:mitochondrial splicing system protein [Rhizina undulata]
MHTAARARGASVSRLRCLSRRASRGRLGDDQRLICREFSTAMSSALLSLSRTYRGPCISISRFGGSPRRSNSGGLVWSTRNCGGRGDVDGSADATTTTTIYALSTAPGKSAIALVRVSGPECLNVYRALCPSTALPKPRVATLRTLYKPAASSSQIPPQREILDPGALILYFPGPHSFTGEDILELHIHGGPAVVRAVLSSIPLCKPSQPRKIRYAEPGEFTRRAFENDRLSLPQIEALGDTLSAMTEQQRMASVRSHGAGLSERYERWRRSLVEARGELEALIDFSEDQHFDTAENELLLDIVSQVKELKIVMNRHMRNVMKGELLRNGISLTLIGAPNAGKSSLLNRIVGREAVIVSSEAGTTRDVVDLSVDLGGFMVVLGDTAGLRVGDVGSEDGRDVVGEIEKEGIRRAKKRVTESDVVIVVLSIELDAAGTPGLKISEQVKQVVSSAAAEGKQVVAVVNKTDLANHANQALPEDLAETVRKNLPDLPKEKIFGISCVESSSPKSIQEFLDGLVSIFETMTSPLEADSVGMGNWNESIGVTERQRLLVEDCIRCLDRFLDLADVGNRGEMEEEVDVVIAAEELRSAAECLAKVTGRGEGSGDVEEVLGVVFERFCVGK